MQADDLGSIHGASGFRVVVHNVRATSIRPDVDGVAVPTGMTAFVMATVETRARLGSPYSTCDGGAVTSFVCSLLPQLYKSQDCTSSSCVPPCAESFYSIQYSLSNWPSDNHRDTVNNLLHNMNISTANVSLADMANVRIDFATHIAHSIAEDPAMTVGIQMS